MKGSCRAAVLTAPEKIELKNIPIPAIGPDEVLVQVKACALCGSDLHAYLGKHPRITFPRIMGHEFSGVIVEKGKQVSGWEIGQRVCGEPGLACEKCEYCREGRRNLCIESKVIGFNVDGAYCEYVKIPQANLYLLPDAVPFEEASVVQTMSIAYNGVKRRGEVKVQDKVVIFGCGPIGACALAIAKASGAEVYAVDTLEDRLEIAKNIGADLTFNATKVDVVRSILDVTQGKGVDKVIEAVGGEQDVTLGQTTQVVKRAGLIVVIGTFSNNRATLRITEFKMRELELRGSQGDVEAFPDCINLIASGKVDLNKIITHYINLDQVENGLKMMKDKNEKVMKIVVRF